jgi:major membrane immunogen (membrane-anchored lipoprotein)
MNDEVKDLLAKQGQVIATLALRVSTMERLLLEKHIITEAEAVTKATELSKEFAKQVQEGLKKAVEESKREHRG